MSKRMTLFDDAIEALSKAIDIATGWNPHEAYGGIDQCKKVLRQAKEARDKDEAEVMRLAAKLLKEKGF